MQALYDSQITFNPMCFIFEAEQEQEQQPEQGVPQEQEQQPGEITDHMAEKIIDLESIQKYLLFKKITNFKETFETKLKYIKVDDNETINAIRDILDVIFEFFPQFSIPQITAILGTLVMYLDEFSKIKTRPIS